MTDERLDTLMHEHLAAIGADLPEPTLSPEARRAILSGEACAASRASRGTGLKIMVGTFGALAACLAVVAAVVAVRNAELHNQLRDALARAEASSTNSGSITLAADQPEYMLVNMFHEGCPRAAAMRPFVEDLRARYKDANVAFVDLNVTDEEGAEELADCLGVGCVLDSPPAMQSGTVKLVNRKTHEVLCSEGPESGLEQTEHLIASLKETR